MKAGYKEALAVGAQGGFPPACSPGAAPPGKPPSCHSPEALLGGYMPGENRPGSSPENSPCPYLNRLEALLRCCPPGWIRAAPLIHPGGQQRSSRQSSASDAVGRAAAEQRLLCG